MIEPGAVLMYEDKGCTRPVGQTLGADGAGEFVVIFCGTPEAAYAAALECLSSMQADGRRVSGRIVVNELGYTGPAVRVVVLP